MTRQAKTLEAAQKAFRANPTTETKATYCRIAQEEFDAAMIGSKVFNAILREMVTFARTQ